MNAQSAVYAAGAWLKQKWVHLSAISAENGFVLLIIFTKVFNKEGLQSMTLEEEYIYNWIHDDITWCGNECHNTSCERNLANKLSKEGLFSMALLKGTPACPLYKEESYPTDNKNTRKVNGDFYE